MNVLTGRFSPTADNLTAEMYHGVCGPDLPQDIKDEITTRLRDGEKPKSIALTVGWPVKRVEKKAFMLRANRQLSRPQSRPEEKYLKALQMWNAGSTYTEIAKEYNCTIKKLEGVVQHYRKRFGWFARRHRYTPRKPT